MLHSVLCCDYQENKKKVVPAVSESAASQAFIQHTATPTCPPSLCPCRTCPTGIATGTAAASCVACATARCWTGPSPPRPTCSCAWSATATSTRPNATPASRPSCQVREGLVGGAKRGVRVYAGLSAGSVLGPVWALWVQSGRQETSEVS